MKSLKVYPLSQELTKSPVWVDSLGSIITATDIAFYDLIYRDWGFNQVQIITSKSGPIGFFTNDQFKEFYMDFLDERALADIPVEHLQNIDKILSLVD